MFKKRIDELGRIVIPKELRNNFKIKDFDELELYIENDSIIIKKSLGIENYKNVIDDLLKLIKYFVKFDILITDKNKIISSTNENFQYNDTIKVDLTSFNNTKFVGELFLNRNANHYVYSNPIIVDSNLIGYLIILNELEENNTEIINLIKNVLISIIS